MDITRKLNKEKIKEEKTEAEDANMNPLLKPIIQIKQNTKQKNTYKNDPYNTKKSFPIFSKLYFPKNEAKRRSSKVRHSLILWRTSTITVFRI